MSMTDECCTKVGPSACVLGSRDRETSGSFRADGGTPPVRLAAVVRAGTPKGIMRMLSLLLAVGLFFPATAFGQNIVDVGYLPHALTVAPGQVVNLYVTGLGATQASASSLPLPTSLGGVSVSLQEERLPAFGVPPFKWQLPIFSVSPDGCCVSVVTVQVPFSATVAPLALTIGGVGVEVYVVPDNIRVVNACWQDGGNPSIASCHGTVTHADGTTVTAAAPARAGEVLVMYAFGLGATMLADGQPYVLTGSAAPSPAPVVRNPVTLKFDFGPELVPTPAPFSKTRAVQRQGVAPLFAGLTPGFVGLYQINFAVPPVPPGTPACGEVGWNLTVTVQGTTSFDGAGICVQAP